MYNTLGQTINDVGCFQYGLKGEELRYGPSTKNYAPNVTMRGLVYSKYLDVLSCTYHALYDTGLSVVMATT